MRTLTVSLLAFFTLAGATFASDLPDWERRLQAIRPPAEQVRWQQIPWLTDLPNALRVAREEKRPLLVWASDDDPLDRC